MGRWRERPGMGRGKVATRKQHILWVQTVPISLCALLDPISRLIPFYVCRLYAVGR